MSERIVTCHGADGKPCGRLTAEESLHLEAAGRGRIVRSRKGHIVRIMLTSNPERGWYGGSHTVRRVPVRNRAGAAVTAPILEHKPVYS